jgi:Hyaluronan / mRNA binding family
VLVDEYIWWWLSLFCFHFSCVKGVVINLFYYWNSGVKAVEKKQGAGGHNWGTLIDSDQVEGVAAENYREENGEGKLLCR